MLEMKNVVTAEYLFTVDAEPQACFRNVERQVEKHGGELVLGWHVTVDRDLHELLHHAVWRDAEGNLRELTPLLDVSSMESMEGWGFVGQDTQFLPDPTAIPLGRKPNRRPLPSRWVPARPDARLEKAGIHLSASNAAIERGDYNSASYQTKKANEILRRYGMIVPMPSAEKVREIHEAIQTF